MNNAGQLPASVTLHIDPLDVTTHGQQHLTMFHGYYDQHQYFPQIIAEPTSQHVFFAQLQFGSMHPARSADECLQLVTDPLRQRHRTRDQSSVSHSLQDESSRQRPRFQLSGVDANLYEMPRSAKDS